MSRLRRGAEGWVAYRVDGAGPFASRQTWDLPGAGEARWESRSARKRGAISVRSQPGGEAAASASIYFAGGLFFNTGGYASLLSAINAPQEVGSDGSLAEAPWRWWSYEPLRIDWLSTFVLFAGTLAFGVSLLDSFLDGLTTQQVNRLIWTPEVFGCALFLISGHLAMVEVCHRTRPCVRRRDLGWAIVAINQVGSILFAISALAAFIRPETSSPVNVAIANWGTLTGALCFAIGGVMQGFERPGG